jgi:hypothetical protein
MHSLSPAARAQVVGPLADAFGQTFLWGLALLGLAFVAALVMAVGGRSQADRAPAAESAPAAG